MCMCLQGQQQGVKKKKKKKKKTTQENQYSQKYSSSVLTTFSFLPTGKHLGVTEHWGRGGEGVSN